jgi:glycyl-tRNA synthetase
MELEFFCKPDTDLEWFAYWKKFCLDFLAKLGLKDESVRFRDHKPEELCFYSKATTDVEFKYFFGWGELWGIADRTDYDLGVHQKHSGESLEYLDPETNEKYIPYVVEPSVGVERLLLAVLTDAYEEEVLEGGETREVLHLHPALAPVKIAVLPLVNKLNEKATEVFKLLSRDFICEYDTSGKIGKRYRRQDSIGTPYCVTVDFDTLEKGLVTVRHRDSMKQDVVAVEDLKAYFTGKFDF